MCVPALTLDEVMDSSRRYRAGPRKGGTGGGMGCGTGAVLTPFTDLRFAISGLGYCRGPLR